jgi:thiol-disulfide isomerase/thioredoxin
MKKIFFLLTLGYAFLLFGKSWLASSLFAQTSNPTLNVSPVIPPFIFTDPISGKDFTPASLPSEVVKMFFFYDPTCDHCQQAAASLAKSADKFKNVQLTWISKPQTSPELIQKFKETYFGGVKLNLHFVNGKGPNPYFGDIVAMPCVFIYGCKDQFIQRLMREEITGENLSRFTLCQ